MGKGGTLVVSPFSLFSPVPCCMMLLLKKKEMEIRTVRCRGEGGDRRVFFTISDFSNLVFLSALKKIWKKIKNVDKKVTSSSYRKLIGFAGISKREIF